MHDQPTGPLDWAAAAALGLALGLLIAFSL